ncbi:MAG: hypothetical protein WBG73_24380 [Coleofasciculaceae cyanobacterium]
MKNFYKSLTIAAITATASLFVIGVQAKPYPDRPGICYFFKGNSLETTQTCVISTGYGAGAQYVILNWVDGVKTRILNNTYPEAEIITTVDGEVAQDYARDTSWYRVVKNPGSRDDIMFCQRILSNQNSVCYKFTDK